LEPWGVLKWISHQRKKFKNCKRSMSKICTPWIGSAKFEPQNRDLLPREYTKKRKRKKLTKKILIKACPKFSFPAWGVQILSSKIGTYHSTSIQKINKIK
jgi:hypothetical protein